MNLLEICRSHELNPKIDYPILREAILKKGIPYSCIPHAFKDQLDIKPEDIPQVEDLIKELDLPKLTPEQKAARKVEQERKRKKEEKERQEQERKRKEEEKERQEQERKRQKQIALNNELSKILITSGFNFDGYKITKYSGYISGDDAISVNRGMTVFGSGTDVKDALLNSLVKIRRNALQELKQAAYDLGCNAVIGVDFDYITLDPETANITGGTTYQPYVFCVTANGNAVIIEKTDD